MNQTVLVTGGAKGIGQEIARRFAQNGFHVAINYHTSEQAAKALAEEIGGIAFQADVSDALQVQAMMAQTLHAFGSIDILVNNAGIALQKLLTDTEDDEWDNLFNVNVKGMFHCCKAVLPGMIHRKNGKIINISSMWGICGASCEVAYSAAKSAVIGFTKALAKELGPSGITVNCVAPGVISTEMIGHLDGEELHQLKEETPLGRIGTPLDVAHAVCFLASEQADFITGQVISPNGGFCV